MRSFFLIILSFLLSGINPDVALLAAAENAAADNAKPQIENSNDFFCAATDYRFAFGKEENTVSAGSNLKNENKKQIHFCSVEISEQPAQNYFLLVLPGDFPGFQFPHYLLFRKLLL